MILAVNIDVIQVLTCIMVIVRLLPGSTGRCSRQSYSIAFLDQGRSLSRKVSPVR